jgi:CPA2 family monovalent cation:H+ antiporter-2
VSELHHTFIITDLALIFTVVGVLSALFRWLKQPIILSYIIGGIVLSILCYNNKQGIYEHVKIWSDIGIIFFLFEIGLEFNFKKLMRIGPSSCIAAITIVIPMILLGYLVGTCFKLSHKTSLFLGAILCMSSTMIITKILNDLHLSKKKFTEIVLGILIIEDLIAIILMVVLSTIAISQKIDGHKLFYSLIKLIIFLSFWFTLCTYFIPLILKKIKYFLNDEMLLIIGIAFCFGMAFFATQAGYSSGLGAFIVGSIIAETDEGEKIKNMLLPIKNFFGMLFFISIGINIDISKLEISYYTMIGIISIIVIIGQLLFATIGTIFSGQNLKTAIFTGFTLTQIGEFSYIIASLGLNLGIIKQPLYQVIIATSIVTIVTTPFMMKLAPITYNFLKEKLPTKWILYLNKDTFENGFIKNKTLWKKLLNNMSLMVGIYFFFSCAIVFFSSKYGYPIINKYIHGFHGNLLFSIIIIFLISPFMWIIINQNKNSDEFIHLWNENEENKMRLIFTIALRMIICISLIMYILIYSLNLNSLISFVVSLIILTTFLKSRQLRKHSRKIEQHFAKNLNSNNNNKLKQIISSDFTNHLMKQDLHLSKFIIKHSHSIVGKTLKELNIRQLFGINIIAIIRGDKTINIPHGKERLYNEDCIVAFGTDNQMDSFQAKLEKNEQVYIQNRSNNNRQNKEIVLQQIEICFNSPLIGKTIFSSKMQENYHCLLVGIERDNIANLNIDINMSFKNGDILWIAGEFDGIKKFENLCN